MMECRRRSVYVSDLQFDGIKVVKSTVKKDHMVIVACSGGLKKTVWKTRQTSRSENIC